VDAGRQAVAGEYASATILSKLVDRVGHERRQLDELTAGETGVDP